MPNYDYYCDMCSTYCEKNVSMQKRDEQECPTCSYPLVRRFTFNGAVWSPTKNGGMS